MDNDEMNEGLEIRETIDGRTVTGSGTVTGTDTAVAPAETGTGTLFGRRRKNKAQADPTTNGQVDPSKTAALAKKKGRPDPYIWGIYIMLLMISIVELFSASSTEVTGGNVYEPLIRHGRFLLIGFVIILWLQKTPYTLFNKFSLVFAVFSLGLLLLSSTFGVNYNGAQRALMVAGITIQPAEMVKLAAVCLLSSILGRSQTPGGVTTTGVIWATVAVTVFSLCLWRNGLTNTILLMLVSICMMIIGGVQWKKFLLVLAFYGVCGGVLYGIKYATPSSSENEYDRVVSTQKQIENSGGGLVVGNSSKVNRTETQKGRVKRFLKGVSATDTINDMNRQVMMSKFSQANGGLFGQGPGNSRESARLPLAFSDYIYSIIVEDTGFVGGAAVLLLYLLLLARAGRIAYKCKRAFPAFLIMGCAVMIVFQALVHMAIVTGVFPVSGQPLPFISKGGTSVIVMSAALGIMLSVARFAAHSADPKKIKAEKEALPADMQAANYSSTK